jgi:hypothetical protein
VRSVNLAAQIVIYAGVPFIIGNWTANAIHPRWRSVLIGLVAIAIYTASLRVVMGQPLWP